jgi:hypothetical protein
MRRPLPTAAEAAAILAQRRTRPFPRPPRAMGTALIPMLKEMEKRFGASATPLATRWKEIVGETLARRTEPVRLSKPRGGGPGVLELKVEGPVAALVQHQAPDILERVKLVLGEGAVERIRIVQGPVRPPPAAKAARPARRPKAPLDAAAEAELAKGLAEAPDGKLKTALLRLGRGVLSRPH